MLILLGLNFRFQSWRSSPKPIHATELSSLKHFSPFGELQSWRKSKIKVELKSVWFRFVSLNNFLPYNRGHGCLLVDAKPIKGYRRPLFSSREPFLVRSKDHSLSNETWFPLFHSSRVWNGASCPWFLLSLSSKERLWSPRNSIPYTLGQW